MHRDAEELTGARCPGTLDMFEQVHEVERLDNGRYRVLELLRKGRATNTELAEAGGYRYAARLYELRQLGHRIELVDQDRASGRTVYELTYDAGGDAPPPERQARVPRDVLEARIARVAGERDQALTDLEHLRSVLARLVDAVHGVEGHHLAGLDLALEAARAELVPRKGGAA